MVIFVKRIVMYYRIKIDELNNGRKMYTPQVGQLKSRSMWVKKDEIVWSNLSKSRYDTEHEALRDIRIRKEVLEELGSYQVKNTTYKIVE
jgi:hypothetical protein